MNKLSRLDIKQLRVFQALWQEQSASKAAYQLGMTQQAVSEQLKKLRDVFGDRLFLRKTNGFVPTPFAERLSPDIDKLLREFQALLSPIEFDPATVQGTYVIAATDYAQQIVLPSLIANLRLHSPNLKIIIRDFELANLNDLMESGKINLAITFPDYIPKSYPLIKLFTEHYVCITSKYSTISKVNPSLREIADHPMIAISPSRPDFRDSIDDWFKQFGLERNAVILVPCFSVISRYLEVTDSIAFLPSRAVSELDASQLITSDLPEPFDVIAAWHPRYSDDALRKWVISLLDEIYLA